MIPPGWGRSSGSAAAKGSHKGESDGHLPLPWVMEASLLSYGWWCSQRVMVREARRWWGSCEEEGAYGGLFRPGEPFDIKGLASSFPIG